MSSSGLPSIVSIKYSELKKITNIQNVECIVNFSFAPEFYSKEYVPEFDVDRRIGEYAAIHKIHYVMISSRKVYDSVNQWNVCEDAALVGQDAYGRNKIIIEQQLQQLLGSKLTILRPGNVIGYECKPGRKRFGAYMLNQLAEKGHIKLSICPSVRRDIVPVEYFSKVLEWVILEKPSGIFNVGAGQAIEIGKVAQYLIEGFGRGELLVESSLVVDEFQLNSSKLIEASGLVCGTENISQFCRNLGEMLRKRVEKIGQ